MFTRPLASSPTSPPPFPVSPYSFRRVSLRPLLTRLTELADGLTGADCSSGFCLACICIGGCIQVRPLPSPHPSNTKLSPVLSLRPQPLNALSSPRGESDRPPSRPPPSPSLPRPRPALACSAFRSDICFSTCRPARFDWFNSANTILQPRTGAIGSAGRNRVAATGITPERIQT